MRKHHTGPRLARESVRQVIAVTALLVMAGLAIAGPSGLLAWQRNARDLDARRAELATLTLQRDTLKNRVDLLDPRHVDRDFATELVRSQLNVASPDEKVLLLH